MGQRTITYGRAGILRQRRNVLTILKRPRRLNPYRSSPIARPGYLSVRYTHSCNRNRDLPRRWRGPTRSSSSSTAAVRSRLRSGSSVPVRCAAASRAGGGALLRLVNHRAGSGRRGSRTRRGSGISGCRTTPRRRISVRRSRAKEDYFTLESRNTLQTTRTWAGACTSSAPSESLGRTSIAHDSRSRAPPSLLL